MDERNIRAGLSSDRAPNRAIRSALSDIVLKESLEPEIFTFNHNGVTLAVQDIGPGETEGTARIVEPRLLNGAQTLTSVEKFLQDNDGNPGLEKSKNRLNRIRVLTKIVHSTGPGAPKFVTEVTIYNNKQNKVDAWNLRANDQVQLDFQDKFRDDLGIYYERQEATFENFRESDLEEMGITQQKAIEMKRLAYTFLASQGEIDRMSRLGDVFENTRLYDDTFRSSYLDSKTEKIVLAYKVQFRLGTLLDEIIERGQNKYGFVTNARYLVWALVIQGLLNREDVQTTCEEYGKDLSVPASLTSTLRDLASKKVRFIIGRAVQGKEYQELLEKEKFGFLRTKSMFQSCMDIAYRREGWTKRFL